MIQNSNIPLIPGEMMKDIFCGHLSDKGFTLVEVLVALTLMAIGIIAIVNMQSVAMKSNTIAYKLSVATNLGQEVIEDLLAKNQDDPMFTTAVSNAVYDLDPNTAANSKTVTGAGTFSANYTTTKGTGSNGVPINVVSVVVTVTGNQINPVSFTGFKRLK